jgi:hypothetical protein
VEEVVRQAPERGAGAGLTDPPVRLPQPVRSSRARRRSSSAASSSLADCDSDRLGSGRAGAGSWDLRKRQRRLSLQCGHPERSPPISTALAGGRRCPWGRAC